MTGQGAQDEEKRLPAHITEEDIALITRVISPAIVAAMIEDGYRKHPEPEITDERVDALAKSWLSIDVPLEYVDVWGGARDEWLGSIRAKARAALEAALRVPVGEGEQRGDVSR